MSNKLLIYELNEIPKRLLDYYVKLRPSSNLAFIYQKGIKIILYPQMKENYILGQHGQHFIEV